VANNLGNVEYVLGYLGDEDILMIVGGHRQEYVGMIDSAFLQVVLHHGLGGEHHSDTWG
jgi:hypothetical protein